MNHHTPGENFSFHSFLGLCIYRVPVSSKLVSLVTKYPNAFSPTSKCPMGDLPPEESWWHHTKTLLFLCFELLFTDFAIFNSMGRPKHLRIMAGALEGDLFVGPKAEDHRGLLSIRYPMEHGIVNDWNDMERIWTHIYSKVSWRSLDKMWNTKNIHFQDELSTFSEEHPVLLTEAPLNPRKNREKAAEIFFETFNVPALFVSMQAVLSLYATGRVTGVVLDSGDGVTHAVPIYEGFAMPHSIMRIDIAGRDVTRYLKSLIRKEGFNFRTTAEFEIVRMIKEKVCYLASNLQKEESIDTDKASYVLPDGNTLDVSKNTWKVSHSYINSSPDWSSSFPCTRSALQARSHRRGVRRHPRSSHVLDSKVRHGPKKNVVPKHCFVRRLDTLQGLRWPLAPGDQEKCGKGHENSSK